MSPEDVMAAVESNNDQHLAAAEQWARESDFAEVMEFWLWLQEPFDDPRMEIASRLAACTLAPLMVRVWKERQPAGGGGS